MGVSAGFCALAGLLLIGCGSDSEATATSEQPDVSAKSKPALEYRPTVDAGDLKARQPEKRVMKCIDLEGGFIEPLAPVRHKREPPSRSFAHGVGPAETHIAIYLETPPQEIDSWIKLYDRIGEYRATKTADGRNLILLDVGGAPLDREVAFHCVAAASG